MVKLLFIFALIITFVKGNAQNKAEIEKTIRDLEQLGVKGILNSDTNILKQIWDPEFIVNTPQNDIAEDRTAVFKKQTAGLINYSSFQRTIEKIVVRENIVVTMGNEIFVSRTEIPGARAGVPVKRRFTNIWMLKNGRWVQIARHASIICTL